MKEWRHGPASIGRMSISWVQRIIVAPLVHKNTALPFAVSTIGGVLLGVVILLFTNASLLKVPIKPPNVQTQAATVSGLESRSESSGNDYSAISTRNLFRAKLEAEIPKPKTDREIEEEILAGILKTMMLKGVMTGEKKTDFHAIIDRGSQKGVWTYDVGEVVERGLVVTDIRRDNVTLQKGDFGAILRLYSSVAERIPVVQTAGLDKGVSKKTTQSTKGSKPSSSAVDWSKEIRREGNKVLISKSLADKIKTDNSVILSSVAIKLETDSRGDARGYKVVTVDKGSVAQKMGIMADDTLMEVNGYRLKTADDMKKAYDNLQNASRFDIKVLRKGKAETLQYEVR